ncbi:MAG: zinc ABC transporter substrate-binding protein [Smithella sp.]
MKKLLFALCFILTFTTPAMAKINIVATLPWIGSLAGDLGKDKVNIKTLVKSNQDPHQIEAKPSMILAARGADLLIYNGLDLEIGYLPLIIESSRNPRIQPGRKGNLDCSQFIKVIEKHGITDRSMGDVHPLGNPHYHLSSQNILRIARGITQALVSLDHENSTFYSSNLAGFEKKLAERQKQWSRIQLRGKKFVAYHRFFEYLSLEKGFQIVGYIEEKPGIPPSAGYVEKLMEYMKKVKPDGIITTAYYGRKEVDSLAKKNGIKSIVVPHDIGSAPNTADWFTLMDNVLKSLQ